MTTQEQVKDVVSQVLADKADKGGIKRVVWIGAGGSNGGNYPAQYFMEHEATQVVSSSYTSNEFVHATPKELDDRCVAVICSLKATAETVEAVKKANSIGAITIAMTGNMDTGMAKVGQYVVTYSNGDDQVLSLIHI